jgi:hypothetical protein
VSDDYEEVTVETREEWRAWLGEHHESAPGVCLITWKKGSGRTHLA